MDGLSIQVQATLLSEIHGNLRIWQTLFRPYQHTFPFFARTFRNIIVSVVKSDKKMQNMGRNLRCNFLC